MVHSLKNPVVFSATTTFCVGLIRLTIPLPCNLIFNYFDFMTNFGKVKFHYLIPLFKKGGKLRMVSRNDDHIIRLEIIGDHFLSISRVGKMN